MTLNTWLRNRFQRTWTRTRARRSAGIRRIPGAAVRLQLESLEDRRMLAAGELDPTFGIGGVVSTGTEGPTHNTARTVSLTQPDGKIVMVGTASTSAGTTVAVSRYNIDGSPDSTFGSSGTSQVLFPPGMQIVRDAELDSLGRIVVMGTENVTFGSPATLFRFQAGGALDPTFDADGIATINFSIPIRYSNFTAEDLVIDSANRPILGGYVGNNLFASDFAVARLDTAGQVDSTFAGDGMATVSFGTTEDNHDRGRGLAIDSTGRIVAVGTTSTNYNYSGVDGDFAVARFNADGSLDTTFDGDGKTTISFSSGPFTYDVGAAVAIDPAGQIVVAGSTIANFISIDWRVAVARLNPNGSLDNTFGVSGKSSPAIVGTSFPLDASDSYGDSYAMAIDAASRIVVGGGNGAVVRFTATGTPDGGFGSSGLVLASSLAVALSDVAVDSSDRVIVAGSTNPFPAPFGSTGLDAVVVRLSTSGALDNSFDGDGRVTTDVQGPKNDTAVDLTVTQPDGKVVIVGNTLSSNFAGWAAARYNVDGTLDGSFGAAGKVEFLTSSPLYMNVAAVTSDSLGRIVVAGTRSSVNGNDFAVVRLMTDGTVDATFGTGGRAIVNFGPGATQDAANDVAIDSSGRIVVVGSSSQPTFINRFLAAVRLNSDGSLDTAFDGDGRYVSSTSGSLRAVAIDASGGMVLVGTTNTATADFAVLRLNADGSPVAGFGSAGVATVDLDFTADVAENVAFDSAGRIIVAGSSGYDAAVVRLLPNGALDPSFGSGGAARVQIGAGLTHVAMAISPDGSIALASLSKGDYSEIAVALVKPDGCLDVSFGDEGIVSYEMSPGFVMYSYAAALAFDAQGRILLAGTKDVNVYNWAQPDGPHGSELLLVRYLGHDPVVSVSPTVAADLQSAIATLDSGGGVGSPRVVLSVVEPGEISAALQAVAGLSVNPSGPVIEIMLDLAEGMYELGEVSIPAGVRLITSGRGCAHSFVGVAGPALTLTSGELLVRHEQFSTLASSATVVVAGGQLILRDSQVEESNIGDQAAVSVTGGVADLGTGDYFAGNTINVNGVGDLIRLTGPYDVNAQDTAFTIDGMQLYDSYEIERAIDHSLDGLPGGTVFWIAGNVFVASDSGNGVLQTAVDVVPSGGTVNLRAGVSGSYVVGDKLLTIFHDSGVTITQQADSLDPSQRELTVAGTYLNDSIRFVSTKNVGEMQLNVNKLPHGVFQPTSRLIARGSDGNDDLHLDDGVTLPAWLYGDYGNDRLHGGDGNDVLFGGDGADAILGGRGRDLIVGGGGADSLLGDVGDDILIAGVTYYEYDELGTAAIMAEWTSLRDFDERVANLHGTGSGSTYESRLNGNNFLNVDTVIDDYEPDRLSGGAGRDWFFASLDTLDKVTDLRWDELLTELGP